MHKAVLVFMSKQIEKSVFKLKNKITLEIRIHIIEGHDANERQFSPKPVVVHWERQYVCSLFT